MTEAKPDSEPRGVLGEPIAGRLHHLDALRGLAMLLGIALHATFLANPGSGTGDDVMRWIPTLIHSFRMPLFFLMAGIFAALVVSRRGGAGFAENRTVRIALPLAVGIVTIVPLQQAFESSYAGRPAGWALGGPEHLWFLEYLLFFYVGALGLRHLTGQRASSAASGVLRGLLAGRTAALRLAAAAALVVLVAGGWGGNPALDYLPQPELLLYYGAFFGLGWVLFSDLRPLRSLGHRPGLHASAALALSIPLVSLQGSYFGAGPGSNRLDPDVLPALMLEPLVGILAISALYGYAVRAWSQGRPVVRYVVDASYWMYLMHIVVLWLVFFALEPLALPWWALYPALCAIVSGLLLASYAAFVRHTIIGRVLHGPRERRTLVAARQPG